MSTILDLITLALWCFTSFCIIISQIKITKELFKIELMLFALNKEKASVEQNKDKEEQDK